MLITKTHRLNRFVNTLLLALVLGCSNASYAGLVVSKGLVKDKDLGVTWLQDANSFFTLSGKGKKSAKADALIADIIAKVPTLSHEIDGVHTMVREDFDPSTGKVTWWGAQAWVTYLNLINYKGFSDWRLPVINPENGVAYNYTLSYDGSTDYGKNNSQINHFSSELGHLYYIELHNQANYKLDGTPQSKYGFIKKGPFLNLPKWRINGPVGYWIGSNFGESPYAEAGDMWHFLISNGGQGHDRKDFITNPPGTDPQAGLYAWPVRTGVGRK